MKTEFALSKGLFEKYYNNGCDFSLFIFYSSFFRQIHTLEEPFLNVNCAHLEAYDPGLYCQLVCYPQEVIPTFDMAINEMFFERYPAAVLDHQIQVRPFNAQKTKNMRSLNPEGEFATHVSE